MSFTHIEIIKTNQNFILWCQTSIKYSYAFIYHKKTTPFGILKAVQQHQPLITLMSKRTGMQVNFQFQQLWMFLAILNLCGIYKQSYVHNILSSHIQSVLFPEKPINIYLYQFYSCRRSSSGSYFKINKISMHPPIPNI